MPFAVVVACAPRTVAERFVSRPADRREPPAGAERFVGGHPWGPAPEGAPWQPVRLVWLESGRWVTGGSRTWTLWDPALGWVAEIEAPWSAWPTPDGAWLARVPVPPPTFCVLDVGPRPSGHAVRFDPDVGVERRRVAEVHGMRMVWDARNAEAEDRHPRGATWRGCTVEGEFGDRFACTTAHTLTLARGRDVLARWSALGEEPAVSVGWSGDGSLFAWRDAGTGQLTAWADGADRWSVEAPNGAVTVSPDGSLVLVHRAGAFAVFAGADGTRLDPRRPGVTTAAALGPDGAVAARAVDCLSTWDRIGRRRASWWVAPTKRDPTWEILTWSGPGICVGPVGATSACFDADGRRLDRGPAPEFDGDQPGEPRWGIGTVARDGSSLTLRSDGALVVWPTTGP